MKLCALCQTEIKRLPAESGLCFERRVVCFGCAGRRIGSPSSNSNANVRIRHDESIRDQVRKLWLRGNSIKGAADFLGLRAVMVGNILKDLGVEDWVCQVPLSFTEAAERIARGDTLQEAARRSRVRVSSLEKAIQFQNDGGFLVARRPEPRIEL